MCDLHAGRVVSNFIMQALQGKPLTVSSVNEMYWRGRASRKEEGEGRRKVKGEGRRKVKGEGKR